MLRPATPLSVLFLIAFGLLLLSSLSTPVIKGISLAKLDGYTFGVWGFCSDNADGHKCSQIEVGYTIEDIAPTRDGFNINPDTRHSVSYVLIVHPIAALLTLVCLCMSLSAHLHAPAHSTRYMMGLFLMTIPTLIFSLLAFLVDVLLFIPHVSWGGWIVLAATLIILAACIVTCGMRRTLISRKAQRRRIAETADVTGQIYYNTRAVKPDIPRAESPPPLSGDSISPYTEKAMGFGAFEISRPSMDDRRPLNPQNKVFRTMGTDAERMAYNNSPMGPRPPQRDPYGNPIPVPYPGGRGGFGPRGGFQPTPGRGGPGYRPMRGGGPPPGWVGNGRRGRGGLGPPPRGGMRGPSPAFDDIDPYYGSAPDLTTTQPPPPAAYDGTRQSNSPTPPLPAMAISSGRGQQQPNATAASPMDVDRSSPPAQLSDQYVIRLT
jgi:hypothetical protein